MFLSKIWFVLVGLLAGVAVTAAFVAPRPADRHIEQLEGQRMDRAQYAAEQMLKNDARRWIDYVAKLGTDGKLIDALDAATRGMSELRPLHESVRNRMRELVPDRAAIGVESIIAVDGKGRVVARVGDDEGEFGESIAGADVVADALRGYLSDDVWGAGNRLRRIGAAPVLSKSHDRIVGALVVAVETGKRLAEMWKQNLGVDVAIVLRKTVLSSTLAEALLTQLPDVIEDHAAEIASHKRTRALPIHMGNERMLVVAAPFAGEAAEQRAYYVLLTKKSPESNPWALLSSTSSDDLKWGKFPWLQLGGGLLAIVFIGLYSSASRSRIRCGGCDPSCIAWPGKKFRRSTIGATTASWAALPAISTPPSSTTRTRRCPRAKPPRRTFPPFSMRRPALATVGRSMFPTRLCPRAHRYRPPWPPRCSARPVPRPVSPGGHRPFPWRRHQRHWLLPRQPRLMPWPWHQRLPSPRLRFCPFQFPPRPGLSLSLPAKP
jgi:hypothetical protein